MRRSRAKSPPAGDMWTFERQAQADGWQRVAGIDEAGRGPLAGPVVAAAVVFPPEAVAIPPVKDSKQLTPAQRAELDTAIRAVPGVSIGVGVLSAADIDRLNILRATHAAMQLAVRQLQPPPDFVLIDGLPVRGFPVPQRAIVKGDALSASIAAASIVAKVYRDRLMNDLEARYPGYGFARHKGYGTPEHLDALAHLGPSPEHRRTFAPVQALSGEPVPEQPTLGLS